MRRTWHIRLGLIVTGALAWAEAGVAQIDHRVNQGNSGTAGRALDANSAVGSSGFNLTRPGLSSPGTASNAIITGNVTGLAGFKGYSPIPSVNAFRDTLPSSNLSGFQARSVGISDVQASRTLRPTYFFDQTQTISDLGYIRQGLNQPGSSTIRSTSLAPPDNFKSDNNSAYLLQQIRQPEDLRVNISRPDPKPGISQTDLTGSPLAKPASTVNPTYRSAMTSSIFGSPLPAATSRTGSGLSGTMPEDDLLRLAERSVAEDPADRRIEGMTNPPETTPQDAPPPLDVPVEVAIAAAPPVETPANLGADRFADLYNAVGVAQSMGVSRLGFDVTVSPASPAAQPQAAPAPPPEESRRPGIPKSLMRKPSEGLSQLATAAQWASTVIEDPIQTFAGANENRLNQTMRQGEDELHKGRYYSAAGHFEIAAAIDPMNPLPLLARGHALAAAGDYRSAVRFLLQGIERFPQIAAFRIDLPAMIGQPDVFDIRRADLESKLAKTENPELRFLLGYLEFYSGLPEEGLKNLRMAATASPPDSVIGMFADLLTGQRELPPLVK